MKARKRLDAITESARERMQNEVSALLGKPLTFAETSSRIISKEDYFSDLAGKYVLARLSIQGELEGEGYLLVTLKDAIRIGGTLIMLPDTELDEAIGNEDYSEDAKDSYGEIANIIAGSFTSTFEEQYPKPIRFVRTTQEIVIPVKVETESDEPCPDQHYYQLSTAMSLDGLEMGEMHFLLPGELFGVVESDDSSQSGKRQQPGIVEGERGSNADGKAEAVTSESSSRPEEAPREKTGVQDEASDADADGSSPSAPTVNVEREKKRLDSIFLSCCEKMADEVGALLGIEYKLEKPQTTVLSKEECLDRLSGKQVMARMEVRGDGEGREAQLFCGLKDAILLGGKLIMLPDSELDQAMLDEDFSDDSRDAYGEVANIIAGVYTAVFEEQYRKSIGFVKTELEQIIPVKIDGDSDDTFVNQPYYHATVAMSVDGRELGPLQTIFPAAIFGLQDYGQPEDGGATGPESVSAASTSDKAANGAARVEAEEGGLQKDAAGINGAISGSGGNEVLIITADETEGDKIAAQLESDGFVPRILHFSDDVNRYLPGNIGLIFLVMDEIDDRELSVAIKIRSVGGTRIPMVAAGPAWTRTKVLKAVKYGADDILITPAQADDIEEKINANLRRKAA